nr:EOG090X098F [Eurycercus lamellatus]
MFCVCIEVKKEKEEKKRDWSSTSASSLSLLSSRGRSASEPSFLSVSRAVKVHQRCYCYQPDVSDTRGLSTCPAHPPTTVKENRSGSITGLQQQIKAAFGRWRKRGGQSQTSSSTSGGHACCSSEEAESGGGGGGGGRGRGGGIREDSFDHPLDVRLSAQSQTFSHPHRVTVFPPFPSPSGGVGAGGGGSTATTKSNNSTNTNSSNPFAFVRGLRGASKDKRRSTGLEESQTGVKDPFSSSHRADTAGWSTCGSVPPVDFVSSSFPAGLGSKSRSDHNLHRILKDDKAWTVFATLRPPTDKSGSLSRGSTAWTFGLFSPESSGGGLGSSSLAGKTRSKSGKAASVAPSPEILHRSFAPPSAAPTGQAHSRSNSGGNTLLPSFLGRNERRTRSLERCSQQRVITTTSLVPPARPPVPSSRVRSRSLEKNYHVSTTSSAALSKSSNIASTAVVTTPLLPSRRTRVPPEVLATWCTFSEAFGGGRPKQQQQRDLVEPLTIVNDERDSPGSPVFEELFLPPPHKFAPSCGGPEVTSTTKRNSLAGSGGGGSGCCCGCSCGGHSAGVSCSSKSTPRSSPVPPVQGSTPVETVLYGSREAPVLERHCVEGGEFIIAWLSHSSSSPTQRPQVSAATPTTDMMQHSSTGVAASAASGSNTAPANSSSISTTTGAGSNRSFINKPARGWLHSDLVIVREGITYFVRYIGCLEVNTSMKSLDFDTRSQIAKECINLVCETAGLKTVDKKRKVDRRIQRILGDAPHMEHAGSDVALTISSGCLRISTLEGSAVVACHDMPNISFASGGDPDTLDFVAYVAKDNVHGRACYVLECGGGLAQDVITTIGQAFELRFKEYLKRTPRAPTAIIMTETASDNGAAAATVSTAHHHPPQWTPDDPEYYNDLPGKVPPDVGPPPVPPLPNYQAPAGGLAPPLTTKKTGGAGGVTHRSGQHAVDLSDNLIDLNADVSVLLAGREQQQQQQQQQGASSSLAGIQTAPAFPDHEYVNGIMGSSSDFKALSASTPSSTSKDPFDMHPFSAALPSPLLPPNTTSGASSSSSSGSVTHKPQVVTLQRGGTKASKARVSPLEAQLSQEIWFHGPVSRKEAEDLLKHDGDFLVRESQGSQGQYVLTGMQSGHHKHLLLVDPEGVVRTKDRTFESVSHLINYHRNNILPIISAESVLLLKRPVPRSHHS